MVRGCYATRTRDDEKDLVRRFHGDSDRHAWMSGAGLTDTCMLSGLLIL